METLFANPLFTLFGVIGAGLLLGSIRIKGIELGSSMVLFVALAAGHFGLQLPSAVGTLGLVVFVYCVGIGAGGRFFRAVAREGSALAKLALAVTLIAAVLTVIFAFLLDLPVDLATGIFAGALTSTPALAGADEALKSTFGTGGDLVIGYGIAYPFGVIGVVLMVQLLPKFLGWELVESGSEASHEKEICNSVVEITNPNLFGQPILGSSVSERNRCQVSRVLHDGVLRPLKPDETFEKGQRVLVVGEKSDLDRVCEFMGSVVDESYTFDTARERRRLIVTSPQFSGKSLGDLNLMGRFGVIVTRVSRTGMTFVPNRETVIEARDMVTVVGTEASLKTLAEAIGHRESQIDATDLLSISSGLALGIFLGMIPLALPGSSSITLGMAGGPLIAGLLLGHFGRVGGIIGYIPRPTRILLQELGLVLFLADAGIKGGGRMMETVSEHGVMVFFMGACVTLVPMLLAIPLARHWLQCSPLQTLGGICGGMTSTPALGAITAKTDSQAPIISYATAYPVALVIMTLLAKILVWIL